MAKIATALTDTQIKNAKPRKKNYSLFDGDGLFLEVTATGSKLWRLKYRSPVSGTDKKISLGKYPTVSLKAARDKAHEYRVQISQGTCPITEKKKAKANPREVTTFGEAALEWLEVKKPEWSGSHYLKQRGRLEKHLLPYFGDLPIEEVTDEMIIKRVDEIQANGSIDTGLRVFTIARSIFKRLKARKKIRHNPLADVDTTEAFKQPEVNNYTAPEDEESFKSVLKAIYAYDKGEYSTRMALRILPHVFLRNESLRLAEWHHIDFEANTWTVPAANLKLKKKEKLKSENKLVIQMSRQVSEMLKDLQKVTGDEKWLFPSPVGRRNHLSENALGQALKRAGVTPDEATPHSFRTSFSTLIREYRMDHKASDEAIERALSHTFGNAVTNAYNRSALQDEFKVLYQWWSDYIESLLNE